jgi:hypothetical protein
MWVASLTFWCTCMSDTFEFSLMSCGSWFPHSGFEPEFEQEREHNDYI